MEEMNLPKTAAARTSEGLDLGGPDEGRPADAGGAVEGVAAPAADQSMRKSRAEVRA